MSPYLGSASGTVSMQSRIWSGSRIGQTAYNVLSTDINLAHAYLDTTTTINASRQSIMTMRVGEREREGGRHISRARRHFCPLRPSGRQAADNREKSLTPRVDTRKEVGTNKSNGNGTHARARNINLLTRTPCMHVRSRHEVCKLPEYRNSDS